MTETLDSRGKTLAAAAKLFRRQGYHGTALNDILTAGGAPRGSLYFHFPNGKEEIGETALSLAADAVRQGIVRAAEISKDAESFLVRIARAMAADLETSGFEDGCPLATTALETSAQSKTLRAASRTAFQSWESALESGLLRHGLTPDGARLGATLALSQLEGALLLSRTYQTLEPMRHAEAALRLFIAADTQRSTSPATPDTDKS